MKAPLEGLDAATLAAVAGIERIIFAPPFHYPPPPSPSDWLSQVHVRIHYGHPWGARHAAIMLCRATGATRGAK